MRAGLIVACLVLSAIVAGQWGVWPLQPPSISVTPEPPTDTSADNARRRGSMPQFQLPPPVDFQEINERPLFVDARRLPQLEGDGTLEPEPAPKSSTFPKHLGLTAVLVTEGEPSALILDSKEKKTLNLKMGDELAGWKIVSIQPDRLVVSQGESRQEMLLRIFDPTPPLSPLLRQSAKSASGRRSARAAASARSKQPAKSARERAQALREQARARREKRSLKALSNQR